MKQKEWSRIDFSEVACQYYRIEYICKVAKTIEEEAKQLMETALNTCAILKALKSSANVSESLTTNPKFSLFAREALLLCLARLLDARSPF